MSPYEKFYLLKLCVIMCISIHRFFKMNVNHWSVIFHTFLTIQSFIWILRFFNAVFSRFIVCLSYLWKVLKMFLLTCCCFFLLWYKCFTFSPFQLIFSWNFVHIWTRQEKRFYLLWIILFSDICFYSYPFFDYTCLIILWILSDMFSATLSSFLLRVSYATIIDAIADKKIQKFKYKTWLETLNKLWVWFLLIEPSVLLLVKLAKNRFGNLKAFEENPAWNLKEIPANSLLKPERPVVLSLFHILPRRAFTELFYYK